MSDPYVLSIDCGTQSIRALLFDKKGNLIAKKKNKFEPYYSKQPGWAEQDPDFYWENLCNVCQSLKKDYPVDWERIIAVALTTHRATFVNIDKDGNALRPAIVWLDERMAKCEKPLSKINEMVFSIIGMKKIIELYRKKSKANWIKENQAKIWEKTYKFLLISGYLIYKLTGRMVDSVASQIGYLPFDYKKKTWAPKDDIKSIMFDIERDKLPELIKPGELIGKITKGVSELTGIKEGLPVIATGSDKGCETLGTGCLYPQLGSISLGSTVTIQTTTKHYYEAIRFLPPYPAVIPGCYNPEIEIFRGYWMVSWFKKEFAMRELLEAEKLNVSPESILDKELADIPPGSQGLILQPYWGWGPGLKEPEAKGAVIGFGDVHTRVHIYRAIIEGINYALLDGIEKIEKKSGVKIERIMISGGGSQSDAICQIVADMLNRPVSRVQTYETSGLGAAIMGFVGMGEYDSCSTAVKEMVHEGVRFEPNREHVEIYSDLYNRVYKKIYPRLKGLYKEIQEITNYPEM